MPSPKRPRTLSTGASSLMQRLSAFLPQMAEANKQLEENPESTERLDDNLVSEDSDDVSNITLHILSQFNLYLLF
jgi:hypothetical protein